MGVAEEGVRNPTSMYYGVASAGRNVLILEELQDYGAFVPHTVTLVPLLLADRPDRGGCRYKKELLAVF
ncbi:MAG: hypothetical protein ACE5MM_01415 [Nitrospiraceae bacterium]